MFNGLTTKSWNSVSIMVIDRNNERHRSHRFFSLPQGNIYLENLHLKPEALVCQWSDFGSDCIRKRFRPIWTFQPPSLLEWSVNEIERRERRRRDDWFREVESDHSVAQSVQSSDWSSNRWILFVDRAKKWFHSLRNDRCSMIVHSFVAFREESRSQRTLCGEDETSGIESGTFTKSLFRLIDADQSNRFECSSLGDGSYDNKELAFLERMRIQMMQNLVIKIRNFHVSYEMKSPLKLGHPFSFGMTLAYVEVSVSRVCPSSHTSTTVRSLDSERFGKVAQTSERQHHSDLQSSSFFISNRATMRFVGRSKKCCRSRSIG